MRNKLTQEEIIETNIKFLNTKAEEFYLNKIRYLSQEKSIEFKKALLTAINMIERTIQGTFDCGLELNNVNLSKFKEMYPKFCKVEYIETNADLLRLGIILSNLRNLNAHAFPAIKDFDFFDYDFRFLKNEYFHPEGISLFNGELTIAGLIYFIYLFLPLKSIETVAKTNDILRIIASNNLKCDEFRFDETINGVTLENEIRIVKGHDILTSIFGEYEEITRFNDSFFELLIGNEKFPDYIVKGKLRDNQILVEKGSKTKVTYEEDYNLTIIEQDAFIDFSNRYPPLCFLDLLYKLGITTFDDIAIEKIKENEERYEKLNKSKFYYNKNIDILLMPSEIADFRTVSFNLTNLLNEIFLDLENYIFTHYESKDLSSYSSIGEALERLNIPFEVVDNIRHLRNFVAHGYILNEYTINNGKVYKYSFNFIMKTLKDLMNACEKQYHDIYLKMLDFCDNRMVRFMTLTKYMKIINNSRELLKLNFDTDLTAYDKSLGYIRHCFLDLDYFGELCDFKYEKVIELTLDNFDGELYFLNSKADLEFIKNYANTYNYEIKTQRKSKNSLIKLVHLYKK